MADRVLVLHWWHDSGAVEHTHEVLRGRVREADGRNAEPTVGLIGSQSVRTTDTVPPSARGFDAGKKVKSRKRFIVTDTLGLLLAVHVVAANVQDRDGARRPLLWTRLDHPGVRKIWADQGFTGRLVDWSAQILGRELESSARTLTNAASRSSPSGGPESACSRGSPPTGVSPGTTRPARLARIP
ncbi:transposase [Kitasatospora sp. KL5]|uniref:transposase n=1 Tax=Kitasatospora sp. KL5 TaxID=3425125 RepID=UPI003D6F6930